MSYLFKARSALSFYIIVVYSSIELIDRGIVKKPETEKVILKYLFSQKKKIKIKNCVICYSIQKKSLQIQSVMNFAVSENCI